MAKIPILDGPSVQATGYNAPTPYAARDTSAGLAQGLNDFGQGATQLGKAMDEHAAKERAKANAISQANADTAYQNAETASLVGGSNRRQLIDNAFNETGKGADIGPGDVETTPGFLSTRGMDAAKQSATVIEDLNKARQKIAETTFADEGERQKWLARSAGMLADSNRKVQSHTAQQFQVAQDDALHGKLATTIQAVAANPYDDPRERFASAQESIIALQASKEGGAAAIQKLYAEGTSARIHGFLEAGDVARARKQYETDRQSLGTQASDVERAIVAAEKARTQAGKDLAGEQAASTAVRDSVNTASGWVDNAKALAAVEAMPATTEHEVAVKDEARRRVKYQLTIAEQVKSQTIVSKFNSALAAYQKSGTLTAVAPADKTWLKNKDNKSTGSETDAWERLRAIARADAEHARGAPVTQEEQRAFGQFAIWAASNPEKASQMTEEQFNAQVVGGGDYQGEGTKSGPLAKKDRERASALLASYHGKATKPETLTPEERALLIQAGSDSQTFGQGKDVTKWSDDEVAALTTGEEKLSAYKALVRKSTGKDPSPKEIEAKAVSLTLQRPVAGSGWFGSSWFEQKKSEVQGGPAAAPALAPKDQQAVDWARAHPDDARSAAILKKNGVQ